jgi:predicted transcriptional regulator YdeE
MKKTEVFMQFLGISREFSLYDEEQYLTIGAFWDEMTERYGLESLLGLGYKWENGTIFYAIGLKNGVIDGADFCLELPDRGWTTVDGKTDELKKIYDEIYKNGRLKYEIEEFYEDGSCQIRYYR